MKWLNGYRMRLVLVGFVAAVVLSGDGNVKADFTFGESVKFGSINVWGSDDIDCFSSDGLEMYIDRTLGADNIDLCVLKRASADDDWGPAVNLGSAVNSAQIDWIASISTDGLTLYFQSNRPGGYGKTDLYMTTRVTRNDPWGPAVNMGPTINSSATDADVWISADGLELYFMSTRSGGYGGFDIWVARRATENDPWGVPVNLGPVVNSAYNEGGAGLSPDGLLLFLQDNANPRPGGYGNSDFWMTRRASLSDPWQAPVNLGPRINGPGMEFLPRISPDGRTLHFWGVRGGVGDVWQAPIIPIIDFNSDGIVDSADVCIMVDHWGENYSLCDIGPMPWGDGVVDVKDLVVLAEHLFEEPYDPSLIAYYKLDEAEGLIAVDSAGENDGMLSGEPLWQPEGGRLGGALQFDGTNDYISTDFVLNPADGPFSIFAWIKGGGPGQVILSQETGADWLLADASQGFLMTELKSGGRYKKALRSQTVVTDGNWHRVGLTWDGFNRVLFVDDVEVARDTQPDLAASATGLYIGAGSSLAAGSFWFGLIDDVRIYDRAISP
jgi:hypothetical protein